MGIRLLPTLSCEVWGEGHPGPGTNSSPGDKAISRRERKQVLSGRRATCRRLRRSRFCGEGFASSGVNFKGAEEFQLFAHLTYRWDHFFAHKPQAAHLVL